MSDFEKQYLYKFGLRLELIMDISALESSRKDNHIDLSFHMMSPYFDKDSSRIKFSKKLHYRKLVPGNESVD